jgi:hypothetical protein
VPGAIVSIERCFARKLGDASVPEVILQLGFLELLDRVARFPDQRRRLRRIGRCPAQQHVAVFEVDRPESGPIRGTAIAIFYRDVLTHRL